LLFLGGVNIEGDDMSIDARYALVIIASLLIGFGILLVSEERDFNRSRKHWNASVSQVAGVIYYIVMCGCLLLGGCLYITAVFGYAPDLSHLLKEKGCVVGFGRLQTICWPK
jgi:hypothetical protein